MLSSFSMRAICMLSLSSWNPPFFSVVLTFFTPCSRSDSPLCHQGATFSHLDHSFFTMLWFRWMVHFCFGKEGCDIFANCSLCCTQVILSHSASPECLSFSVKANVILQALCCSRQHQQYCYFSILFANCDSDLATLSFILTHTLAYLAEINHFSALLSGYNGLLLTHFLWKMARLMIWPCRVRCSRHPPSHVVSFLLLVSTLLFFQTVYGTVSSNFFNTQVSSVST